MLADDWCVYGEPDKDSWLCGEQLFTAMTERIRVVGM
jgi:hypothetical protein